MEEVFLTVAFFFCNVPINLGTEQLSCANFILDTDVSDYSIGGALLQLVNGQMKIVAYYLLVGVQYLFQNQSQGNIFKRSTQLTSIKADFSLWTRSRNI